MSASALLQQKANAEALIEAFRSLKEPANRAMVAVDPWSNRFVEAAQAALAQAVAPLWPQVRHTLAGLGEVAALQQAWAVALSRPLWSGMLYRACVTLGQPGLQAEADRLRGITLQRWKTQRSLQLQTHGPEHQIAQLLLGNQLPDAPAPDLGGHTALPGSIRLRYRLAWHLRSGATLQALLKLAAHQRAASEYQRRVELERAVHHAVTAGRRFRPLREVELGLLGDKERALLLSIPHLWPVTLPQALFRRADLKMHVNALATEAERVRQVLEVLMQCVRSRHLGQLESLATEAGTGPIALALWRTLKDEPWGLEDDYAHAARRPEFGPWVPTSAATLATLQRVAPAPLPGWWAMTASQAAAWLMAPDESQVIGEPVSAAKPARMTVQDLAALQRTWSRDEHAALLRAQLCDFVPNESAAWEDLTLAELIDLTAGLHQRGRMLLARRLKTLRDARPLLALMASKLRCADASGSSSSPTDGSVSPGYEEAKALRDLARQTIDEHFRGRWSHTWGRWLVASAGTPVWRSVRDLALERTRLIEDAMDLLQDGRKALNPAGLRLAVAESLHDARQVPREPVAAMLRWLQLDPAAITTLATRGPVGLLLDLASNRQTPNEVLQALVDHGPAATQAGSVRMTAWRQQMRRAPNAERLRALALQPPEHGAWAWRREWMVLEGEDLPLALVLAARRSGWRLIELQDHLGEASFAGALARALPLLQGHAPREAAALELVGALGVQVAPHLMRVLAMTRRGQPAGHKLNHAYQRHLLPKKSGGTRIISAPDPALKRVQRAVLDRLLAPLGQHAAAHGFAPGHSILGNAQTHVGQTVVANADVRACFPSVRWPLVLGALKRDLAARLSPVALSLLCDLCTAEGGLPIGAPTSPALLNRVLLKTDEILSAAAQARGVRYTRYADDLSFSGENGAVQMLGIARHTLAQIGLELDPRKTNIFRRGRRQVVTGLVVNDQVSVPRRIRRRLRAAVHRVEQGQAPHWHGQDQGLDALQGRLAFLKMVNAQEGSALVGRLDAARAARGSTDQKDALQAHSGDEQPMEGAA